MAIGELLHDGMSSSMKQLLETMCGGDFMSKNREKVMDFLSYVAEVSRGWDEPNKGEMGKTKSQPNVFNAKAGMYTLNEDIDMKAKIAAMTRRLEELELKKIHEVQAVAEAPLQVKPCPICQSYEHLVEECPTIPAVREMFGDQANAIGQFKATTMLHMEILTTQIGGTIQISPGSQEHLTHSFGCYELLKVVNDKNESGSYEFKPLAQGSRFYEQLKVVDDMNNSGSHELRPLAAMNSDNPTLDSLACHLLDLQYNGS
ncbi:hypothetical protein CK203_099371 [Vitis vinifera]|uniref:Retrotransposon gag domain-containing protein n=1 Tax=Vitis vinifera TaxID=29760 RepID=A0A438CHQ9_VITVI|nr:hypothetical protein CK203_099371 [Vitis vinifera]